MTYSGYFLSLSLNKIVLGLLLLVYKFRFFVILIRQCCVYDVSVFPYVVYNVDIWCLVVVGYAELYN
jgi:hypothetical protein